MAKSNAVRVPTIHGSFQALECVKVLSITGVIQFINDHGLTLLEACADDDVTGMNYVDLWPAPERPMVAQAIRDAAAGKTAVIEGFCPTLRGTPRYWELSFYSVQRSEGPGIEIISVSRDISSHRGAALAARTGADLNSLNR